MKKLLEDDVIYQFKKAHMRWDQNKRDYQWDSEDVSAVCKYAEANERIYTTIEQVNGKCLFCGSELETERFATVSNDGDTRTMKYHRCPKCDFGQQKRIEIPIEKKITIKGFTLIYKGFDVKTSTGHFQSLVLKAIASP
jgi:hypothetical protein